MSLRHVKQRHSSGCGIAAAAMLTGASYARVLRQYRRLFPDERGYRTEPPDIRRLLTIFGFILGRKVRTRRWTMLRRRALVAINRDRATGYWHWVVFEPQGQGGYVLDPKGKRSGGRRRDFGRMRLTWYHIVSRQG